MHVDRLEDSGQVGEAASIAGTLEHLGQGNKAKKLLEELVAQRHRAVVVGIQAVHAETRHICADARHGRVDSLRCLLVGRLHQEPMLSR
eukprot:13901997-Alexandrium_andersonii.AAC.1